VPVCSQVRSPVAIVTSLFLAWLNYGNATFDSAVSTQATSVGDELCCWAGVLIATVRPHHSTPPPTALSEGKGLISSSLSLSTSVSTEQPSYLADELSQPADFEARRRLRSASSPSLIVRRTRLSTVGDRAFPVAAAHTPLEQSAAACHVCSMGITVCLPRRPEDTSWVE